MDIATAIIGTATVTVLILTLLWMIYAHRQRMLQAQVDQLERRLASDRQHSDEQLANASKRIERQGESLRALRRELETCYENTRKLQGEIIRLSHELLQSQSKVAELRK